MIKLKEVGKLLLTAVFGILLSTWATEPTVSMSHTDEEPVVENGDGSTEDQNGDAGQEDDEGMSQEENGETPPPPPQNEVESVKWKI